MSPIKVFSKSNQILEYNLQKNNFEQSKRMRTACYLMGVNMI